MLNELFLMKSVEVSREGFCLHSFYFWLTSLGPLVDLKRLVLLLICGFKVELGWLIVTHPIIFNADNYLREALVVPIWWTS